MAGIRISRHKGFTFGNVMVSNTDDNGVYLMRVEKPSTPTLNIIALTAPGRDGMIPLKDRYSERSISVTIGIYKKDISERRQTQRTIITGLILKEDKLYFHDEPDMYYVGEVFDEIQVSEQDFFTELTVTFKCKPFIYKDNTSANWTGIISQVTKSIINTGNFKANPIIKIEGRATRVSVTIGDRAFSLSNVSQTTYVDTENMIVYNIIDGNKVSALQSFSGLFPTIPTGTTPVIIGGEALNISVSIIFVNTYIC